MKNLETGLTYARLDSRPVRRFRLDAEHEPSWTGAYVWCLRHNDYESAELIRKANLPESDQCQDNEHDECHLRWCGCRCHRFVTPPLVGKPIRSCSEMASEEEEMEAV